MIIEHCSILFYFLQKIGEVTTDYKIIDILSNEDESKEWSL